MAHIESTQRGCDDSSTGAEKRSQALSKATAEARAANGCRQLPQALHFRARPGVLRGTGLHLELPWLIQCLIDEGTQELQLEPGFNQSIRW
jgi:hypothetical protein